MGCRSDYLEPNHREAELQRAAKLLSYALAKMGQKIPQRLEETAGNIYATEDYVPTLCRFLRGLTQDQLDVVVYNAHDADSRDLANWWEEHQKADEARETAERETALLQHMKQIILNKLNLTEEELRKILDS